METDPSHIAASAAADPRATFAVPDDRQQWGGFPSFADTGADGKVAPFQTFRARPAMEAGVSKRLWSLAELVEKRTS